MKKINFTNAITYLFVFTLAYILGVHSAMPKETEKSEYVTVTARLCAPSEPLREGEACYIDRQSRLTVTSFVHEGETCTVSFLCEGKFYEAGFLTAGGRYLTVNQPISPVFSTHTSTGRIISILRTQNT